MVGEGRRYRVREENDMNRRKRAANRRRCGNSRERQIARVVEAVGT